MSDYTTAQGSYTRADGKAGRKDPNYLRRNTKIGGAVMIPTRLALDLTRVFDADEGLIVRADGVGLQFGSGAGLFEFDGVNWKRVNRGGENNKITCTAGASIFTAAQKGLLWSQGNVVKLTAAGPVTVGTATTAPILPAGYAGQKISFVNVGSNTITLTDQGTMAASNILLASGATLALAANKTASFVYVTDLTVWVQD